LESYVGVYDAGGNHRIGIDRFINDAGEVVLLFADYGTSIVRQLFEQPDGSFVVGPGFAVASPADVTLRFVRNASGKVAGLTFQPAGEAERTAVKVLTRDENVSFSQSDATLSGTLILPEGPGPYPAITLLHGSGPLSRYSFGPYPRFFSSLGFAVLIYDKRGTGQSTGWRLDASTGAPDRLSPSFYPDDLRGDALSALALLQGRSDIYADRIGFWGSSEGGMLATQAAARNPEVAFAINSCGFMGPLWQTLLYQAAIDLEIAGASEAEIAEAVAFNLFALDVARTGARYEEFLRRRRELVDSGRERWIAWYIGDYQSLEQMRWSWDHVLSFDPTPALRDVKCPALGIFGEFDRATESAKASVAMRAGILAGGNRDVTIRIIPNASHSLTEQLSFTAPRGNRMAPGTFDVLREWVGARVS
jgi:pimeloyl-ACP methyl ester carboxylesterase